MSEPVFFCTSIPAAGESALLTHDEMRHATGARRLRAGDAILLFDGQGQAARAVLTDAGSARVVELLERRPRPKTLHVASALPKGDRQSTLIDMATQLGMTDFTPLACARSVARAGDNAAARWQRIALEACKQSRRWWLPVFHAEDSPLACARAAVAVGEMVLLADPAGEALPARADCQSAVAGTRILVGPEGGFTDEEHRVLIQTGARPVALGTGILRIETAAVALLALGSCDRRMLP